MHNDWCFGQTTKVPMMTATVKADDKGLASPKGHVRTMAMGAQADNCATTTKAIAECISANFVAVPLWLRPFEFNH